MRKLGIFLEKILSCWLSLWHYLLYGALLALFHPIQWICIHWIGKRAHENVVNVLNFTLIKILWLTGNRVSFSFEEALPQGVPLIFVANHQSVYDIPPLIWYLRKYHPKFVGKKELGKGIPSIAINLKHNGSVLIDRNDSSQAVSALTQFAQFLQRERLSGVIFPEGTRSRNGVPKPFKIKGLSVMMQHMPDAFVVPITINHSWKVLRYGVFPLGLGNQLDFRVHRPVAVSERQEKLIQQVEAEIKKHIV